MSRPTKSRGCRKIFQFATAPFLLQNFAKMIKNGLNTEVLGTTIIKLGKLEEKKLTRHKQSNKQSFKLSAIKTVKSQGILMNFAECEFISHTWQLFSKSQIRLRMPKSLHKLLAERSKQEGISMNQY